ncbi:coiled-coil domain-containing protein 174 isoform X2 [Parasteatoda tepidariorum]|uniref:coiled-coil domain-containing protein 174 isoform X2 n=1 Tax=Parasteatoda tepidariorum TaxID=114398 RepID=UPI001C72948E|nr:coiled-coil domain-containing protein 174 isoform X2 [Parasteatoda tepidariorum]
MDAEKSSLSTSSLIDLKAELQKKYDSFRSLKVKQKASQLTKVTPLKNKGEIVKEKKVKQQEPAEPKIDNEDLELKKSRLALEAKAKLYEKIVSNKILLDEEQKDNYLVDFERKELYNPIESGSNETKDPHIDSSNHDSNRNYYEQSMKPERVAVSDNSKSQLTEDPDQPIHYQNVQYNEIRDHGTGYFAFSEEEEKRKEQMEELNSMRQETGEQRLKNERLQKKRRALIQARLTKICERRNIDVSVVKTYTEESETNEDLEGPKEEKIDLSEIPLPEIKQETVEDPTVKKGPKIRPWDMGKDNLQYYISQKKIKTQNQWIEEKREERPTEFAPPSFYR